MAVEIIPAILVHSRKKLKRQLTLVKGLTRRVLIDIVGDKFAANPTITVDDLEVASTSTILDVQLMVQEPIGYLNRCDRVGVERVYGHVEQMVDQGEFVETATDLGMQVGLGLDIHTPVAAIEKMLPYLDGVLLMSVEVAFQGQEFDEGVLGKIEELEEKDFAGDICIDGGLNLETVRACRERGANHFSVGSYLWKSKNIKKTIAALQAIE